MLAEICRTVEDGLVPDEVNPVLLEHALDTVGRNARNIIPA